jgi:hypothetical protein
MPIDLSKAAAMAGNAQFGLLMRQRPILNGGIRSVANSQSSSFGTVSRSFRPITANIQRQSLNSNTFNRNYATVLPPPPPPPPKKKSTIRAVFRWTWRAIYITAIAGTAYAGYGIYVDKHPPDQLPPDPKKKTLVVLGKLIGQELNIHY